MKIFIAGIMQGSIKGKGIQEQDYRELIRDAVKINHPEAEVIDPFSLFPDSVEYGIQQSKKVLFDMGDEAGSSDIVIAYLPEASLGTALEMIRAYDNGKTVICISPMDKNWFIQAVSKKVFPSLNGFLSWVSQTQLGELINSPAE